MTPPGLDPKTIASDALARPAGPERSTFLDGACRGDAALRLQVAAILKALDEPSDLPGSSATTQGEGPPAAGLTAGAMPSALDATLEQTLEPDVDTPLGTYRPALSEGPGTTIGPYKLLRQIGEGGMGTVFMAEQERPVRRKVALKVIKPGMDTGQVVARFEAERQALAIMEHPNIARVLDAGATATGRPFFVMELVDGVPITEYCDRNGLTPRERLALFIPVCRAIQHAHQKGIIHRDIKPSNVLVTLHDGKPVPKVIDFGVAKAIDQRLTERTMFTEFGAVVGTLEYMSPEQAEMGALDIDTRSDVYSLGVLLYELLTGSTPLERAKLRKAAYSEILKRIREEEPAKPSTRLSESKDALPSISAQRKTEPARLTRLVRGELDWIVMRALEKDRTRRYETAAGFARDVERYLDGDPVEAGPPSATYKLRKFAHKHRAALATAGAFAVLLVAATAVSAGLALWADRQRVRAVKAEKAAEAQRGRAEDREQMAIDAVRRYGEVVAGTPELKNNPGLAGLRATLLKEPQAFFRRLRDRLQADRATAPESLARLARAASSLGRLTDEIGDKEDALRAHREALAIRETLARENPSVTGFQRDLAESHHNIGALQNETGRPAEALASFERVRAIRERLARENPSVTYFQSDLANTQNNIGALHGAADRTAEALASFERARAIQERLAQEDPSAAGLQKDLAANHNNVGVLHSRTGRPAEALASFERARAIQERLVRENPSAAEFQSSLATSHDNIGLMRRATGRPQEALASFERARAIRERLALDNPSVTEFQGDLAEGHNNIGKVLNATGLPAEALASLERAREIRERLAREHPSVTEFQRGLAESHQNIGDIRSATGRTQEALASFERARAIRERLARENPSVVEFQSDLATSHNNIGLVQSAAGRPAEAMASYERAREILERLAREHPDLPDFASHLGGTLNNIARVDQGERRFDRARGTLTLAVEWQRKALAANPNHLTYRQFLANHLDNLARADEALGRADEADEARREMAKLRATDPRVVALDARLAAVLGGKGKPRDEAERIQLANWAYEKSLHASSARLYTEALANDPGLADDRRAGHRYNAACAAALAADGKGKGEPPPDDEARAKLRRQARDWLRAEHAAWARVLDDASAEMKARVAPTLRHWKEDGDLAGIRDATGLARLPEPERAALKQLWDDVDRLLARAAGAK